MSIFSFIFIFTIAVTFALYWWAQDVRIKNLILAVSSVGFYAVGGVEMSVLLVGLTLINYLGGCALTQQSVRRCKLLAGALVIIDVGTLVLFKYFDFFADDIAGCLSHFGIIAKPVTMRLFVPLGLSFYIFMLISHVVDCYKGKMAIVPKPESFFAYIAFYPHLFAGPIDRSRNIIPQLETPRIFRFEQARAGLWQILNGLFKKVAVADTCAACVDSVWGDVGGYSSLTLLIVMALYSMQIYCDFSGFSDIALGLGKLFGLDLMVNFRYPYFSRNISEFWRHWHISLTTWLTEYVYVPLGGSRQGRWRTILNTLEVFALCGLWHGDSIDYLLWGVVCGLMFIPYLLQPNPVKYKEGISRITIGQVAKILVTFMCITFSWVIFRGAQSPEGTTLAYFQQLLTSSFVSFNGAPYLRLSVLLCFITIVVEWTQRRREFALDALGRLPKIIRWLIYITLTVAIFKIYQYQPVEMSTDAFIYQNF